jgi:hypothetical protein
MLTNKEITGYRQELTKGLILKIDAMGIVKVSKLCNIPHSDVSSWMSSRTNWSLEKMARIYEILKNN